MKHLNRRRTVAATLAVAALVAGGTALAGASALADEQAPAPATTAPAPAAKAADSAPASATTPADSPRSVEHQSGIVMEGSAELAGEPVTVTVYENSLYGSSVQVVLGDPEDDRIGYLEQPGPFVTDGQLHAQVKVNGEVVELSGSVTPTGRPERSTEPMQDAGEQIVTSGTHTQLATDVTVHFRGEQAPVTFAPAVAYDLQVQKVDLYGR